MLLSHYNHFHHISNSFSKKKNSLFSSKFYQYVTINNFIIYKTSFSSKFYQHVTFNHFPTSCMILSLIYMALCFSPVPSYMNKRQLIFKESKEHKAKHS